MHLLEECSVNSTTEGAMCAPTICRNSTRDGAGTLGGDIDPLPLIFLPFLLHFFLSLKVYCAAAPGCSEEFNSMLPWAVQKF